MRSAVPPSLSISLLEKVPLLRGIQPPNWQPPSWRIVCRQPSEIHSVNPLRRSNRQP
jgi:hypothetical protein